MASKSSKTNSTTEKSSRKEEEKTNTSLVALLANTNVQKAALLTILAAMYSPISLLSLSPVYGSLPSSLLHRHGMMASALLAFVARFKFSQYFRADVSALAPILAFWIPSIQYVLFQQSGSLGNPYGPFATEALTYFPLVALTIYSSAGFLGKIDLSSYGEATAELGPAFVSYVLFTTAEKFSRALVNLYVGSSFLTSRIGLQLLMAGLYGLMLPSKSLWLAIPSLAFTLGSNIHTPIQWTTDQLNTTLNMYNYTLLERRESSTGYLSVLENTDLHYRVMRCDHSLLGGEWTNTPRAAVPSVAEPIYAIFAMLEAVRLVEPEQKDGSRVDAESSALTM